MLDNVTITLQDIKALKPTAEIDGVRLEPYILEAQDLDLCPVLGDVLYNDFMDKFMSPLDADYAKYQNLLNGTTYTYGGDTIKFKGLKPFIIYKTLARFVAEHPLNITRFGVVKKTVNQSQPVDVQDIRDFVNKQNSNAQTYQNGILKFLGSNQSIYTKFKGQQTSSNTGFRILNGSYNKSFYP